MRVLHVLANSPPDTNGYAIRSHMLAKHQNKLDDIEVFAISSPFYPQKDSMVGNFEIDGIEYNRCVHPVRRERNSKFSHKLIKKNTRIREKSNQENSAQEKKNPLKSMFDFCYYGVFKLGRLIKKPFSLAYKVWEERVLMKLFQSELEDYIIAKNIDIIHAHTPYRVGITAQRAAKKTGKKFVYEVRGIWEETAVANGRWKRNGLAYSRFRRFENRILKSTERIISISEELEKELISRGIPEDRITVVPNGIELHKEEKKSFRYDEIVSKLKSLEGELTVGYIGSLRNLEGVDLTARAVSNLVKDGNSLNFFCLTGLDGQEELSNLCDRLGLGQRSLITGPVPHKEVGSFYDLIDIFVVSRPDYPVTRIITPLKPFEAMIRARPVVVTNLPALTEIVEHLETGLVTETVSVESLEESIIKLVNDKSLRKRIGENAKSWVAENRNWDRLAEKSALVYQK